MNLISKQHYCGFPSYALIIVIAIFVNPTTAAQEEPGSTFLESLGTQVDNWIDTPANSIEEAIMEANIKDSININDPDLHDLLNQFWAAPAGSEEESRILVDLEEKLGRQVMMPLIDIYSPATILSEAMNEEEYDLVGGAEALPQHNVDLVLTAPESLEAGEQITVLGEITNRGSEPIWLVNVRSQLTIPMEIWGNTRQRALRINAFFTTTPQMNEAVLRLEGGSSHSLVWFIEPTEISNDNEADTRPTSIQSLIRAESVKENAENNSGRAFRFLTSTFWRFLFFRPDSYPLTANVHVWSVPPEYNSSEEVQNIGDSTTVTASTVLEISPPQPVLMAGAMLGGIICFFLRYVDRLREKEKINFKLLAFGLPSAMLLCMIGTVLLSRMGNSDFPISIDVQDFWGAIATGFIIQLLGLSYFLDKIRVSQNGDPIIPPSSPDDSPLTEESEESEKNGPITPKPEPAT
ncbi:MAG: hypothetical protein MRY76_10375 [Pseudomonadales bacterium]|nr:hypothetical protein [Pseudomonadales bacterium]